MTVLKQMLEKYDSTTVDGAANGLREVMQEIALAGLYRSGFFEQAAFYGGTCLRIFYGLPRFPKISNFHFLRPIPDFLSNRISKLSRMSFQPLVLRSRFRQSGKR